MVVNTAIDLSIEEVLNSCSSSDIEEILRIINSRKNNLNHDWKHYYLSNEFKDKQDVQICTDKQLLDKFIRILKYNHPEMAQYVIDELSY